ncbi:MAG: ATP-binding protein [Candidatus Omnitrophica bacterium]|nr:ATP-binding protein [Candidatus Omnitrophota bacterium]
MRDRTNAFLILIALRFIIATVILVTGTLVAGLRVEAVYWLAAAAYFSTVVFLILLLLRRFRASLAGIYLATAVLIDTALVHVTGGVDSILVMLYPINAIAASLLISPQVSILFSLLASALYAAAVGLAVFGGGFLPGHFLAAPPRDTTYLFSVLYFHITVICIIGFLGSYVAEQVRRKERDMRALEERLRHGDRLSAIGKLAAATAHEIRNPLASISGCVEALQQSLPLDATQEKLFALVMKEVSRLNTIINGMLEYARFRPLQTALTDLPELLDAVIELVRAGKECPSSVSIQRQACALPRIWCDPAQIKQVFFNLLVNAVEAVAADGRIDVHCSVQAAKNTVEVAVTDNGAGMDEERQRHLFEPFASGKTKGVGLGLAISAAIVREHGGRISGKGVPGRGSTFTVALPVDARQAVRR